MIYPENYEDAPVKEKAKGVDSEPVEIISEPKAEEETKETVSVEEEEN
jgi:hypothetical protein